MPAHQIASLIEQGFDDFYKEFMACTRKARTRFDKAEWLRMHEESQARIDLYQQFVARTLISLEPITRHHRGDLALWKQAHKVYEQLTRERIDVEVAETFFNAITRKLFHTVGVQPEIEFLDSDLDRPAPHATLEQARHIQFHGDLEAMFSDLLASTRPALRWLDAAADARWLAARFVEQTPVPLPSIVRAEVMRPLFFRVHEGYIVGRIVAPRRVHPLVVPLYSTASGVSVDGLLTTTAQILPVFSSTRSYFFVDVLRAAGTVEFLASLMPDLTRSDLYISIAHHRHGKSLIYRELVDHLRKSDDRIVVAPGIRGLVMTVFTMPTYRNVFKVIRDSFDKPATTRDAVLRSYRSVFRGQRVGRMADTQEFEHLAFQRSRFAEDCLAELLAKAGRTVKLRGDEVVIDHCYIEEKMTPLNIYLQEASEAEAMRAIVEYGDAIKELATHNIFAGDLLWKNFGVSRSGRLVLYDYDEIQPMAEVNFRAVPQARSWEDELSARPYYSIGERDVFPEEWAPFVVPQSPPAVRDAFLRAHADLVTPEFWQATQRDLVAERVQIVLPYRSRHQDAASCRPT